MNRPPFPSWYVYAREQLKAMREAAKEAKDKHRRAVAEVRALQDELRDWRTKHLRRWREETDA